MNAYLAESVKKKRYAIVGIIIVALLIPERMRE